jgi:hypothetical protein
MADDDPDVDPSTFLEDRRGPRPGSPEGDEHGDKDGRGAPQRERWRPGPDMELPSAPATPRSGGPETAHPAAAENGRAGQADAERLRSGIETLVHEQLAALRSELIEAVASVEDRLRRRVDALAAERPSVAETAAASRLASPDAGGPPDAEPDLDTMLVEHLEAVRAAAVERTDADVARLALVQEELRVEVARLAEGMAALGTHSAATVDLATIRAQMDADAEDHLAVIRADAVAAAGARVADAEARLAARLDLLDDAVRRAAEEAAASRTTPAPVGLAQQDVALRLEALEARVEARADGEAASVTPADLEALAATIGQELTTIRAAGLAEAVDAVEGEAAARVALAEQVEQLQATASAGTSEAAEIVAAVRARLDGLEERIDSEMARLAEAVDADRHAVDVLRDELEVVPAEELPSGFEHLLETAPEPGRRRLGRKDQVRRQELEALADVVERLRARSLDAGDLAAVRADLEADVARRLAATEAEAKRITALVDDATTGAVEQLAERLDEMAAWVLAEATKVAERVAARPAALAPLRSDLRKLKEQVETVAAPPNGAAPARAPATRRTAAAAVPAAKPKARPAKKAAKAPRAKVSKAANGEKVPPRPPPDGDVPGLLTLRLAAARRRTDPPLGRG